MTKLFLDNASPGMCSATIETCHLAWMKARHLIRCTLWHVPLLKMFTVAILFDHRRIVHPPVISLLAAAVLNSKTRKLWCLLGK